MDPEKDWDLGRNDQGWTLANAGGGALRASLIFCSAAIALALILTPMLDDSEDSYIAQSFPEEGIDRTVTGSVGYKGVYTIRRSVLQSSPDSVCVIRDNGLRSGDC